ncbi:MAG: calcium/sodium antiporter [Pseudomonadales bacterium]|nr:calcium/sodium antiporter [Pseudomonadales bacterium]
MALTLVWFVTGLLILMGGAESLVRGSSALALRLGVTPLVIGLTVVAFGTSSPELAVSIESALKGSSSIALGNVIGSNVANIGLILGVTAMIRPMKVQPSLLKEQIPLMIVMSFIIWFMASDGHIGFFDGIVLTLALSGFLYHSYRICKDKGEEDGDLPDDVMTLKDKTWFCALLIVLGLAGLIGGGMLFVNSAVEIARLFEVDEAIIGLTIVAIGTSMPELATSVVAAIRKQSDIAIGNIVGSNIFNLLAILGIASLIRPLSSAGIRHGDYLVMIAFAVILLPMAWSGRTLSRPEGTVLLLGYLAYMAYIWP